MTSAEEVKKTLGRLHKAKEEYTVAFSGKKNGRVNGTYKPDSREITIHDGNFANDSLLMYTAIHELAHHVQNTEYGERTARAHTNLFWAVFHGLLDKAEEAGIYRPETDEEIERLAAEAKRISAEIARLRRELGAVITRIAEACEKKGLRAEDVIERRAQISRRSAAAAVAERGLGDSGAGADIQEEAARERDALKRAAILEAGAAGKSAAQAKQAGASAGIAPETNETETLEREKNRIEKTIAGLRRRLEEITARLGSLAADGAGEREITAADRLPRVPGRKK